jgi:hypothetical protein
MSDCGHKPKYLLTIQEYGKDKALQAHAAFNNLDGIAEPEIGSVYLRELVSAIKLATKRRDDAAQ